MLENDVAALCLDQVMVDSMDYGLTDFGRVIPLGVPLVLVWLWV